MTESYSTTDLIHTCVQGNRKAQKAMYDLFAPRMFSVCLRFFPVRADAEDVLQEGFINLFKNLKNYRFEGSFEGWVRRIFVNTAIQFYRSRKPQSISTELLEDVFKCTQPLAIDRICEKELIAATSELHDGYRNVFRMYAIEGYAHKDIGKVLGISESTSKSQYSRARARMREILEMPRA